MSFLKKYFSPEPHPHPMPAKVEPPVSSETKMPDWEHVSSILNEEILSKEDLHNYLTLAIKDNNPVMLKQLILHGTKHKTESNYEFMLPTALNSAHVKLIQIVRSHCGFIWDNSLPRFLIDGTHDPSDDTRYKDCVDFLLLWGFKVNPRDFFYVDIIFEAARNGYLSIVLQYIKLELCIDMKHPVYDLNVLAVACLHKQHKVIATLLQNDVETKFKVPIKNTMLNDHQTLGPKLKEFVKLSSPDCRYITCLHIAVFNCDLETTNLLIKHGVEITDYEDLFNLICLATQNGWDKIVDKLLNLGADASDIHSSGKTLLHFCIRTDAEGDYGYEVAKILLEKGAQTHLKTQRHQLAVAAAYHGHTRTSRLFKYHICDPFFHGCHNPTLLHEAIEEQIEIEIIADLLKSQETVNLKNCDGHTTLHVACKQKTDNQLEVVELLLRHGADINAEDNDGRTVLHKACETKNIELVSYLLKCEADPNHKDHHGRTPLHAVGTVAGGPTPLMVESFLKTNQIDISEEDGYSQLFGIYRRGQAHRYRISTFWSPVTMDLVDVLVQHGANVNVFDDEERTPLHVACETGNAATIRCLLDRRANVYCVDGSKSTPLHLVIKHNEWNPHLIDMLLRRKVNVNSIDNVGRSILHYIAEKKDGEITEMLDTVEFNVDVVDKDGNTPLHIAVKNCNGEMFEWLMKYGANINFVNNENRSALNEAMEVLIGKKKSRKNKKNIDYLRQLKTDMISKLRMKVIALNVAKLEVNRHNLNIIYGNDEGILNSNVNLEMEEHLKLVETENQCMYELKYLKDNKIFVDDYTFFDLLKDHIAVAKRCVRDHNLLETLEQKKYEERYPVYIEMIRSRLRKAYFLSRRFKARISMIRFFRIFINDRFTDDDADKIVKYLETPELEVFDDLMKSYDDCTARRNLRIQAADFDKKAEKKNYFNVYDYVQRFFSTTWWN